MSHEVHLWLGGCVIQNLCSYQGPLEAPPQMPGGLMGRARHLACFARPGLASAQLSPHGGRVGRQKVC